jgi:hypothetical protein
VLSLPTPWWQIDVQKQLGTEYWTNVYHCAAANQTAAKAVAAEIVILERQMHRQVVTFTSYRVAPYPGPSEGTIIPIGQPGLLTGTLHLPLFNVLRVDFPAPTGRPSRKYYRLPIGEDDQTDGFINEATRLTFQSYVDTFFAEPESDSLIDVDGQPLTSGVVMRAVGMRQLRRGSRRRLLPVIPVA